MSSIIVAASLAAGNSGVFWYKSLYSVNKMIAWYATRLGAGWLPMFAICQMLIVTVGTGDRETVYAGWTRLQKEQRGRYNQKARTNAPVTEVLFLAVHEGWEKETTETVEKLFFWREVGSKRCGSVMT